MTHTTTFNSTKREGRELIEGTVTKKRRQILTHEWSRAISSWSNYEADVEVLATDVDNQHEACLLQHNSPHATFNSIAGLLIYACKCTTKGTIS